MDRQRLVEELTRDIRNLRFERLCRIAEAFGFRFRGGRGSHRIYVRPGVRELLNFQDVDGKAKPYQVRQLLRVVERHGLVEEGG